MNQSINMLLQGHHRAHLVIFLLTGKWVSFLTYLLSLLTFVLMVSMIHVLLVEEKKKESVIQAKTTALCTWTLNFMLLWVTSHLFPFSGVFFKVQLPSSLAGGAKLRVKVEMVLSHVLKPFPTHITQAERQLVVFQGNHYLYSPYPTRSQTTRVRLASKTVESYTKLGNPSKNDEFIEYGPFRDVAPFSEVNGTPDFTSWLDEVLRKMLLKHSALCVVSAV